MEGYRVRDSALSPSPPLKVTTGSDSAELETTFIAVNYMNSYTFTAEHQLYGVGSTATNWPRDAISGSLGTVLHYYHTHNQY